MFAVKTQYFDGSKYQTHFYMVKAIDKSEAKRKMAQANNVYNTEEIIDIWETNDVYRIE